MSGYFVHGGTQYPYGQAPQQDSPAINSGQQLPYYGNAYSTQQVSATSGPQYGSTSKPYDQSTSYPSSVTDLNSATQYKTSYDNTTGGNFIVKQEDRYSANYDNYGGSINSNYSSSSSYRNIVGQGRPGSKSANGNYVSHSTVNAGPSQSYSTGGNNYGVTSSFSDDMVGTENVSSQSSYEKALHNAANQYYHNRRGGGGGRGGGRGHRAKGGRGSFTQPAKNTGPKPIKATEVKAYLYAWCGQRKLKPDYEITSQGQNNKVVFQCKLIIQGLDYVAEVVSNSKKDSQTKAAWDFCEHLVKQGFMKASELPEKPTEILMKTVGETTRPSGTIPAESNEFIEQNGGWTISNSRQRLHQFCQRERISLEFGHTNHGPEHAREFNCKLTIHVPSIQKDITANEKGHNKKQAAALCALSIVRQLYSHNLIEKVGGKIKHVLRGTLMGGPLPSKDENVKVNKDEVVKIKKIESEQVTSGMKRKAVDQPPANVDEFGNWTAENSRQRLSQFCQTNNILCDVLYTEEGGPGNKTYTASLNMKILPEDMGEEKQLEAVSTGQTKKDAAVGVALKIISQLYKLSFVEANPKKKLQRSKSPAESLAIPFRDPFPYYVGQGHPDSYMFSSPFFGGNRGMLPQHRTTLQDIYLNEKHKMIYPCDGDLEAIQRTVRKIEMALKQVSDNLEKDVEVKQEVVIKKEIKEEKDEEMKIEMPTPNSARLQGVMRVGTLAKGLLLKEDLSVELVLLSEDAPTSELLNKVAEILPKFLQEGDGDVITLTPAVKDSAIYITNLIANPNTSPTSTNLNPTITINVALYLSSRVVRTPKEDGNVVEFTLNKDKCMRALAELRHTKWFQTCANGIPSCVIVIRIIREMSKRLDAWKPLSDWAIELVVEKALSSTPIPLSLGGSFIRVMEVIASGVFLPGGIGIKDPCEKESVDVGENMTIHEREILTAAAQNALRLTVFKKPYEILGMEIIESAQPYNRRLGSSVKKTPSDALTESEI